MSGKSVNDRIHDVRIHPTMTGVSANVMPSEMYGMMPVWTSSLPVIQLTPPALQIYNDSHVCLLLWVCSLHAAHGTLSWGQGML